MLKSKKTLKKQVLVHFYSFREWSIFCILLKIGKGFTCERACGHAFLWEPFGSSAFPQDSDSSLLEITATDLQDALAARHSVEWK